MSSIIILDSLCPFQLTYNVRSMAELTTATAIGFDVFGWLTTVFEFARVVLVRLLLCVALPPSMYILRCIKWSHHKLMDRTDHMRLVQILPCKPFVYY